MFPAFEGTSLIGNPVSTPASAGQAFVRAMRIVQRLSRPMCSGAKESGQRVSAKESWPRCVGCALS